MSCIVSHKVNNGERDLEKGGALRQAGVCNCVREQQRDDIQRQSMTFQGYR